MSDNMQQSDDGKIWVPAETMPEPWTWKWIRRIRRLFRSGKHGQREDEEKDE